MAETNHPPARSRVPNTWRSILVLIGFILIGMSVGNILAAVLLLAYLATQGDFSMDVVSTLLQNPEQVPNGWYALMILQSTAHLFTFLVPSLVYWYYIERRKNEDFNFREEANGRIWLLVMIVVIAFMPFNSLIIEWNAEMKFPHALQGLENWMRGKEDQLARLTEFLTDFESFPQLIIALLVIALIPAIGEEVLFRGVLQRKLAESWSNVHLAIWVTAAIFSAIHIQFYGFLPRLLLGALFGYLYFWSGRLSLAIFAHFVNNGFTVLMVYLYHLRAVDINIEDTRSVPLGTAVFSFAATAALLYSLWRWTGHFKDNRLV